jgi:hypothetical protein
VPPRYNYILLPLVMSSGYCEDDGLETMSSYILFHQNPQNHDEEKVSKAKSDSSPCPRFWMSRDIPERFFGRASMPHLMEWYFK